MARPDVFHAQSQVLVPYPSSKKESSEIRVCVLDPYIATRDCPRGNMQQSNPKNMPQVSTSGATRLIFYIGSAGALPPIGFERHSSEKFLLTTRSDLHIPPYMARRMGMYAS